MIGPDPLSSDATRYPLPPGLMHDLRTPLNHIIGYSELMMEQADEEGNPEFVSHLEKVRAAGFHMLALLDENFIVSRAPEGANGSREPQEP